MSIVVPCFNAQRYLEETLESVLAQTFSDWVIIAVDDASTDGTPAILARWQERLGAGRMRIIRQPENLGLGTARNTGIAAAQTEFIAFIDSDDLWMGDHLERAIQALVAGQGEVEELGEVEGRESSVEGQGEGDVEGRILNQNSKINTHQSSISPLPSSICERRSAPIADLVFSPTISFWDDPVRGRIYKRLENPGRFPGDLHKELFVRCFTVPAAAVFRKKVWEVAGPFHTDRRIEGTEDHHFWMSVFEHGFQVEMIELGAILYRRHNANMTGGSITRLAGCHKRLRSCLRTMNFKKIPLPLRLATLAQAIKGCAWAVLGLGRQDFWQAERAAAAEKIF